MAGRDRVREDEGAGGVSCQRLLRRVLLRVYFNFSSPRSPSFPDFSSFFFALQCILSCSLCFSTSSHMLFIVLGRLGAEQ